MKKVIFQTLLAAVCLFGLYAVVFFLSEDPIEDITVIYKLGFSVVISPLVSQFPSGRLCRVQHGG